MKKVIFLLICFFSFFSFVNATEETLGDLRETYNNLVAEQSANNQKTAEAKAEIAEKEAAIEAAEEEITKAEAAITEAEEDIEESNQKIEELTDNVEIVLMMLQQLQSENAYVEYLSGATSMTDLVTRVAALEQISDYIQDTMKTLENEIKENEALKEQLEQRKTELSNQITSYNATINALYSDIEEYDEFALDIDTQVEVAKEQLETYENLCQSTVGSTADDVKLSDCTDMPVNTGWLKPLTYGYVTSAWGYRTDPITGTAYSFHNGIDIGGNKEGTAIYAAAAGVVVAKITRGSCGGNMLYINVNVGGEAYTTYYYHLLSFNVDVGDVVTQNTIIGYVGGGSTSTANGGYDRCTTGAHLHFGVQKGYYNVSTGIIRSNIITPPGFINSYGYRFYSRTQMD